MSARRLVVAALATVVTALIAYTLYWNHGAGQARKALQDWAESKRGQGWTVGWSEIAVGGFPFRLTLTLTAPSLTSPAGFHWDGPRLDASVVPLWPRHLRLSTSGTQYLGWPGGERGITVTHATANVGHADLEAHVHDLRDLRDSGFAIADMALSLAALPGASGEPPGGRNEPAPAWRFALSAQTLELGAPLRPGLGQTIALAEISGRIVGAFDDAPPLAALANWSKRGGTIELERVALDWPPLGLEGDGTAALDPDGQPLAALSTRVIGLPALMDRLAQSGTIDVGSAQTAKTMLSLMAKPDPRGRAAIATPLTIQDGWLYLGPARLVAVPAIAWADFPHP